VAAFSGASITGEPFDLSTTAEHIFVWISASGSPDTLANGGFGIAVIDDAATDAVGQWYVGPRPGYLGGWVCYVVHPEKDFHAVTAGTPVWTLTGNPGQLTAVDAIGCRWKITTTIMGASDNAFIDAVTLGLGYRLTLGDAGSTEGTFTDFISYEETVTNRFGGLFSVSGILFAQCQLTIGVSSGAGNTEFIDDGFTVVWIDAQTSTESAVKSDFYKLEFTKGSGTTDVTMSNGSLSAVSPQEVYLDFTGSTTATLTNVSADRARLVDLDSAVSWTGGQISNSGQILIAGSPIFTDINVVSPTDTLAFQITATAALNNISNIAFDGAGVGGAGSGAVYINIAGAGPFTFDFTGFTYANRVTNSHDIVIAAGSNANYTLNITAGDTPTVNNLGSGTVTIVNAVETTLTGLVNPTEVRVYDAGTGLEIAGSESVTTGSFAFSDTAGNIVNIRIFSTEYEPADLEDFTIPLTDSSLPVQQRFDRNYSNP
jgi:hypothetical protein